MKQRKRYLLLAVLAVLLAGFLSRDLLLQAYVRLNRSALEEYAAALLSKARSDDPFQYELWAKDGNTRSYGPWETTCWSQRGAVEFVTSAFGIVPSSHYKGFYYSEDNTHMPFQATEIAMTEDGNQASWTWQGNYGTSTRICDHWFWFEAHF